MPSRSDQLFLFGSVVWSAGGANGVLDDGATGFRERSAGEGCDFSGVCSTGGADGFVAIFSWVVPEPVVGD